MYIMGQIFIIVCTCDGGDHRSEANWTKLLPCINVINEANGLSTINLHSYY